MKIFLIQELFFASSRKDIVRSNHVRWRILTRARQWTPDYCTKSVFNIISKQSLILVVVAAATATSAAKIKDEEFSIEEVNTNG